MIALPYNELFFLDFSNYRTSPFTFNTKPRQMVFERLVKLSVGTCEIFLHQGRVGGIRTRKENLQQIRLEGGKNVLVLSICIITLPLLWLTDEEKLGDCKSRRILTILDCELQAP